MISIIKLSRIIYMNYINEMANKYSNNKILMKFVIGLLELNEIRRKTSKEMYLMIRNLLA